MIKRLLVLLIFMGILISGCTTREEIKNIKTQTTVEQGSEVEPEPIQEKIKIKEDINLLAGYNYPINVQFLNSDSSKIIESGKIGNYAIRIFVSDATCNGSSLSPGGGCKGEDWGPPNYDYINVDFNLSDEKRSYSDIDGAWETSPRMIGVNKDNILIEIKKEDYSWRVSCAINITKGSCGGGFMIFNNIPQSIVKNNLVNELTNLDIINDLSEFELIVQEGHTRPSISPPQRIVKNKEISPDKYCEEDEDCIKARGNCCGCTGGGTATAINKDFYAKYEEGLGGCGCVGMMSTDISCFAKPICLNHECVLDYNNYNVCKDLDYYNDWCYWQFAMSTNNISLCEKISTNEPNVKPSVSACKNKIGQKENEEILSLQANYTNCNNYLNGWRPLKISQSFQVEAKKLTRAEFIATGTGSEDVILHLREGEINGTEITNMTRSIKDALKNKWIEWNFNDVSIDSNKEYFFVFECPTCVHSVGIPEKEIPPSHMICFWYATTDLYSEGRYWSDDEPNNDWDMAFKLYGIK